MSHATESLPRSIRRAYQVADEGEKWRLTCRSCRARWAVAEDGRGRRQQHLPP